MPKVDLKKINNLINRMERAAEEIQSMVPDFEWSYKLIIQKSKPED